MITKAKLYQGKNRKKSIRGWIYSVGSALFFILMAVILLAAKRPEKENGADAKGVQSEERKAEETQSVGVNTEETQSEEVNKEKTRQTMEVMELKRLQGAVSRTDKAAAEYIMEDVSGNAKFENLLQPHIPLVVIDAGHGGMDSGCLSSKGKVMEKDINLEIALLLRDRLLEEGCQVVMTRETDEILSKEERVELANSCQADVYVSIHQNTYEGKDKSVGGIETWYDGADETRDSQTLAGYIHKGAIRSTGAVERALIDSSELYVLSKTQMPACLIETGFLSNPEECNRLLDTEYQEKLAEGIADGIIAYMKEK